jgi:putative oxidoreductase
LQRHYSKFPGGWAGVALLLLRASATINLIVSACGEYYHERPHWYLWGLIPLGASLCAGFLTKFVTLLAVGVQLLGFTGSNANPIWLSATILNMLALSLLGPGAYSLDALRFGRRLLMSSRDE